ncbi:hypothetical protein VTJ83DRAFT_5610 [Remersonia thermophila]|uniref:Uncharacterized protein n=1 Tax=Remersonia thermophila TaxID=72144 RepID=A0ABR4D7C0_9PEZI
MSNGPLPSQLCLLSDLPKKQVGDKVRFLGCVVSYTVRAGVLTLEHRSSGQARPVRALVDANLILESLGRQHTRDGEWVNVIGYITDIPDESHDGDSAYGGVTIRAQAILLWSAGPVDPQQYEASVKALAEAGQAGGCAS